MKLEGRQEAASYYMGGSQKITCTQHTADSDMNLKTHHRTSNTTTLSDI